MTLREVTDAETEAIETGAKYIKNITNFLDTERETIFKEE